MNITPTHRIIGSMMTQTNPMFPREEIADDQRAHHTELGYQPSDHLFPGWSRVWGRHGAALAPRGPAGWCR
jgi:hypothetical protein